MCVQTRRKTCKKAPRAPPADVNTQPASPASTANVNAQPTSARDVYWENHFGEQQHCNQEQCAGLTQPSSLQRKRRKSGSQGNDLILDLTTGTKKNVQIVQTMTKLATGTALVAEKTDGKIDEEQSDCGVSKRRKVVEVSLSETHEDNTGQEPTAGGPFYTRETQDDSYFSAYADIGIHEDMLADTVRTNAYRLAILRCWEQIRGKVVVDVGAGTGILSLFCVQAGARKVYAIEASALAEETRKVVKANGMEGRIEVVHGRAEEVELPEKVDVIVSEWMGYSLLYESMLPSVIYVRDKWLKKGGLLLPSKATMYLAPITDAEVEDRLQFWEDIGTKYHVDMSALKPYAHRCITRKVQVKPVQMEDILATPAKVMTFDLTEVSAEDLSCVQGAFSFSCYGWSQMQGFATWFDVLFPSPKPVLLSTSPYSEDTHWMQSVMSLDESVQVTQDTRVNGVIKITPNSRNNRFLDMALKYSIDGREEVERLYPMDDCR
ncbi:PRMT6 [Branchiostoma lanceolatum]|uniref:Protein arginine N-methyltransferase 6 n=1 Tax=Branchiostoma lanceolatum TaxID=7740 RepID=A0A8K0EQW5_BRALA|nr:PRMT6 [Branchiostoma lanceolatum]